MKAVSRRARIGWGVLLVVVGCAMVPRAGGAMIAVDAATRMPAPAEFRAGMLVQQRFVEGELLLRLRTRLPVEALMVWDAWTRADQLVQWFPHEAEMTVTEGGEYQWRWEGQEEVWRGSFVEVVRPEVLVFTWTPPESYFPEGAYETTVRLTFEETEGETTLTLEHAGFRGAPEMEATLSRWEDYLYNLRAYLLRRGASSGPAPAARPRVTRSTVGSSQRGLDGRSVPGSPPASDPRRDRT